MSTALAEQSPTSTLDPYADEALLNPWPLYGELREMGPVVWLERYGMFALTRYDAVAKVLRDWQAFPSSFGVMMNDEMNQVLRGNTLCSDGEAHNRLRRVVMRPIMPAALTSLKEEVEREAEAVVDPAAQQRTILRDRRARNPSAGNYRLQRRRSSGGRARADDGVEHWPVQLLRPDERAHTQRRTGTFRNDALCAHPCRFG